jgi:hypothetical protein
MNEKETERIILFLMVTEIEVTCHSMAPQVVFIIKPSKLLALKIAAASE